MAVCAQASFSQRATWPPSAAVRVAVGFEIAQALNAPLDIVLVRKIGVPWQPELALGAVTDGTSPETFIDRDMAAVLDIPDSYVQEATVRQLDEIERRRRTYCAPSPRCRPARCNRPGQGVDLQAVWDARLAATCWSVCVRAFLAWGISAAHRRRTIVSGNITGKPRLSFNKPRAHSASIS